MPNISWDRFQIMNKTGNGGSDKTAWGPFPGWGCYFSELAYNFARCSKEKGSVHIVVAVPTRGFASSFFAFGIVQQILDNFEMLPDRNFERLKNLPKGTILCFARLGNNNRHTNFQKAIILCSEHDQISLRLWQNRRDRAENRFREIILTKEQLRHVRLIQPPKMQTHLNATIEIHQVPDDELCCPQTSNFQSSIAIVGVKRMLWAEMTNLYVKAEQDQGENLLVKHLRLEDGQNGLVKIIPRSRRTKLPKVSVGLIFDGSGTYLAKSDNAHSASSIVILDRPHPEYQEAVSEVARYLLQSRNQFLPELLPSFPVPSGCEILAYRKLQDDKKKT